MFLHLKQIFLPIIWNCTEGEGDGIESKQSFKSFSTLLFFLFRNHWIGFQNRKSIFAQYVGYWVCMIFHVLLFFFSILTYFIMMLINDAKYFSIRIGFQNRISIAQCVVGFVWFSMFLFQFLHILLWCLLMMPSIFSIREKSSYSKQKGNAKLILLHFWRSRLFSQSSP